MSKARDLMDRFGGNIARTVELRPGGPLSAAEPAPADKYAGAVKSRAFAELPVAAIQCAPQPREVFEPEALKRLADSIKRFGQLAPIRVRHDLDRGAWVVLVGERRLRACVLAGLERVRVELVEREMTETDVLAEQIVENAVRADLQPVEQARAYRRLMEVTGWTAQDLAETLCIDPTGVYRALGLLRLPDDVAALVDAGEIKATAAYEISKLQIADEQREVAEKVAAGVLDYTATAAEVKRRQKPRKSKAKKSRGPLELRRRGPLGVRVILQAPAKLSTAEVVEDLREVVRMLEAELSADQAAA
jgi:ParB family chromosome partitioning protein